MASEITVSGSLSFAKSGLTAAMELFNKVFDMAAAVYEKRTFSVPTTAGGTALPLGDVTTPGWCFIRNLDTANYVTILNATSGNAVIKLKAGEWAIFRFAAVAPAALANTSAVTIEYLLLQD